MELDRQEIVWFAQAVATSPAMSRRTAGAGSLYWLANCDAIGAFVDGGNKPFFMYFCTGAMHAPHHVPKEWADKYQGKFDAGWDAYREQVF